MVDRLMDRIGQDAKGNDMEVEMMVKIVQDGGAWDRMMEKIGQDGEDST